MGGNLGIDRVRGGGLKWFWGFNRLLVELFKSGGGNVLLEVVDELI